MRIIDIHTHPIFMGEGAAPDEIDELVRYSQSLDIERMVALGDVLRYGERPSPDQITAINDETRQLVLRHPDFFVAFCYLNPRHGEKIARQELDARLAQGFRGIKLEIANNASDFKLMDPIMRAAREARVPVLQHTWDTRAKPMRANHSDPIDTCRLARRHPDVTVIMAHLYGFGLRGAIEAEDLPNVLIDTSSCLPFAGLLEAAVEKVGGDRILYGSDLPLRELGQCIGRVLGSAIPEEAKRLILYQNAARLLD